MHYYADLNLPPWLWLNQMYVAVKLLISKQMVLGRNVFLVERNQINKDSMG